MRRIGHIAQIVRGNKRNFVSAGNNWPQRGKLAVVNLPLVLVTLATRHSKFFEGHLLPLEMRKAAFCL